MSILDDRREDPNAYERSVWRFGWLMANGWLLFLMFPLVSVFADDITASRKLAAVALLALFALAHSLGYRSLFRRELGLDDTDPGETRPWIDRGGSAVWFVVLLLISGAGLAVGGWAMLGVTPFIVSFAIFNFPWPGAVAVFAATVTAVLVGPAIGGVLDDVWFFSIILVSVGGACALTRVADERQGERADFVTELAVSDERQRVARDVHDVLGHSLTAVILKGQVIDRLLARLDPRDDAQRALVEQAQQQLVELDAVSRRALAEIRSTVGGLRTADLADELTAARAVLADAGVALTVRGDQSDVVDAMRPLLGWVVRESVTNVVRHAQAAHCTIDVAPDGGAVIRITDDGVGMPSADRAGNGLAGLRERVAAVGARLCVADAGDGGTVVEVRT